MTSPSSPRRRAVQGTPILVVDDDPLVRQAICWALEDEGLPVEAAADGREALERAARHRPALVVLDVILPVMDGYEVAAELRARHGEIPILAITASGGVAAKARRMGAFAYLSKPFEMDELLTTVLRGQPDGR